jgi:serine protease Do
MQRRTGIAALWLTLATGAGTGCDMPRERPVEPGDAGSPRAVNGVTPVVNRTPASAASRTEVERTTIEVAREASPAVVSVARDEGSGSGIIIRQDGVIITNAHVVGDARTVRVGLADGRTLDGRVLGGDPSVDVAVVRVDASNLPVAELGDADQLEVGQSAIAIGNPLGLDRTVTSGVVSAVNRTPTGIGLDGLIQTDAAISPGNSGGPLLDSQGRVIGINTVVIRAPGSEGLGFAIPIGLAVDVTNQILQTGKVTRAFLGIGFRDVDEAMASQFNLPVEEGVVVIGLAPSAPAARAGLQTGDIITGVDGTKIAQGGDLRRVLRAHRPGDTVTLRVRRASGEREMKVRLVEAPQF